MKKCVDVQILPSAIQHGHTRCQNGKIVVNQTMLFSVWTGLKTAMVKIKTPGKQQGI